MPEAAPEFSGGKAAGAEASRRRAFSFPKAARIVSRPDFEALYGAAPKFVGKFTIVWAAAGKAGRDRLGVAAAKRTFHDAHQRNRAKRLIRESFRLLGPEFASGPWDLAVAARRRILSAKEGDVREDLRRAGARLGFVAVRASTGRDKA